MQPQRVHRYSPYARESHVIVCSLQGFHWSIDHIARLVRYTGTLIGGLIGLSLSLSLSLIYTYTHTHTHRNLRTLRLTLSTSSEPMVKGERLLSRSHDCHVTPSSPENEEKAQLADTFFSQRSILPSPWPMSSRGRQGNLRQGLTPTLLPRSHLTPATAGCTKKVTFSPHPPSMACELSGCGLLIKWVWSHTLSFSFTQTLAVTV